MVTETYIPITGYLPINNEYQKTLVVTPGGDNEIIFYYVADTEHALVQRNHYIQTLSGGWEERQVSTITGDIGTTYSEHAIDIPHYTFSDEVTQRYNITEKKDAFLDKALPGAVQFDAATDTVSGELTGNGLQLNLYYVPNTYTYTVNYLEKDSNKVLAEPKTLSVPYGTLVTEQAIEIVKDLDGDGQVEDFRLFDPSTDVQQRQILGDNISINFYYVRCTKNLTVSKQVANENSPDLSLSYSFKLHIQAADFQHQTSYAYEIREADAIVQSGWLGVTKVEGDFPYLSFSLKHGQTITIKDLPTAEYVLTEENLLLGYYTSIPNGAEVTLDKDNPEEQRIDVTNTYDPAALEISKTVAEAEASNTPVVSDFKFTVTFPQNVTLEQQYAYTLTRNGVSEEKTVNLAAGQAILELKNGDVVRFGNLPLGEYTVEENNYESEGYNTYYRINDGTLTDGQAAKVTLARGDEVSVNYRNLFPVGDLQIQKTVTKEFHGTAWTGDTFRFTVVRNNKGLIPGNRYTLLLGTTELAEKAEVNESGNLIVTISFDEAEAAQLNQADAAITKTLTIKDLPLGTYIVTEDTNEEYDQSQTEKTGLELINKPVAEFTNKVKLPRGSLYLAKELVKEEGYTGDLDMEQVFSFTVQLQGPAPAAEVQVAYNDTGAETKALTNGSLTVSLKPGQHVLITGLPAGQYRITEATEPYYANKFAKADSAAGPWTDLNSGVNANGCLYADITVPRDNTTFMKCTNVYPVDTASVILHKQVTGPIRNLPSR